MHFDRDEPGTANGFQAASAALILDSHLRLVQRPLLADSPGMTIARRLYHASFVVLAHDGTPDPVFFYANLCAQQLFEMSWRQMVSLPSRRSAEPVAQTERRRLLDRVSQQLDRQLRGRACLSQRQAFPHRRSDGVEPPRRGRDERRPSR
jgi:hypothetical protein